jgi:hypothetical protein
MLIMFDEYSYDDFCATINDGIFTKHIGFSVQSAYRMLLDGNDVDDRRLTFVVSPQCRRRLLLSSEQSSWLLQLTTWQKSTRQPQRTLVGLSRNASTEAAAGGNATGDEALATISSNVKSPKAIAPNRSSSGGGRGCDWPLPAAASSDDGDAVSNEHGWPMATSGSAGGDDDERLSYGGLESPVSSQIGVLSSTNKWHE